MIHLSKVLVLMDSKSPFSLSFVKKSTGEIIEVKEAVSTSSSFENRTHNIQFTESNQIRKIKNILIVGFNGLKVVY